MPIEFPHTSNELITLRDLIKQHPDWLDLPIGIYRSDGNYDYVGAAGFVSLVPPPTKEDDDADLTPVESDCPKQLFTWGEGSLYPVVVFHWG